MKEMITTIDEADLAELYQAQPEILEQALAHQPELLASLANIAATFSSSAGLVAPISVDPNLPEIVLLHGITDSHLANTASKRVTRIWLSIVELLKGTYSSRLTLQGNAMDAKGTVIVTDGYAAKKYQAALDRWKSERFRTHVFQYDWRKSISAATVELGRFLGGLESVKAGKKVVLVCHSMGGLVAATYAVRNTGWRDQIEHCVFVGSPLGGSYSPVESILGMAESIQKLAKLSLFESQLDFQRMVASFPGLIDMLPNPILFADAADLYEQRGWPGPVRPLQVWLDQSRTLKDFLWTSPIFSAATHLVSSGRETISAFPWDPQQMTRTRVLSLEGDGAVMNKASLAPGLTAYKVDGDHGMLVTLASVQDAVIRIAKGEKPDLPGASAADLAVTIIDASSLVAGLSINVDFGSATPSEVAEALAPRFMSASALEANVEDDTQNTQDFDRTALKLEEFSWQNALSLAVASKIAYRRDVVAVKSLAKSGWGFSGCETFDCQETQGFVCWDDRVVVLAYRGTEQNLADWIRNLDVVSTDRPRYGAVHAGFYNGFNVAQDAVEGILNSIDRIGEKTLWVTGHSLGGALSVIAAAEFQGRYKVAGVYTYGQPKVGRDLLEGFYDTHFKGRLHRVINHEDVVPMVPPFYQHFGELYHFDGNADLAAALAGLSAGEASVSSEPVRELSKPEFDELQVKMDALCEPAIPGALALPPSEPEIEVNAALFGVSVSDHDLGKGYIPKVRAQRLRS